MARSRRAEWVPDDAAVEKLLQSDEATAHLMKVARTVASKIQMIAPIGETGDLAASYQAKLQPVDGKLTATVMSTSNMWHWFEYGSVVHPAQRLFKRGFEGLTDYTPLPQGDTT